MINMTLGYPNEEGTYLVRYTVGDGWIYKVCFFHDTAGLLMIPQDAVVSHFASIEEIEENLK